MPDGSSHYYQLDQSISVLRDVGGGGGDNDIGPRMVL